jgi:hypothetical protein
VNFFKKIKKPQQESQRLEGFEKECKELNEKLKVASVKHQEALKNKSKELFEIEIRLKEEISQFNKTKVHTNKKLTLLMRKIKSTMISIIENVHTVHSEV